MPQFHLKKLSHSIQAQHRRSNINDHQTWIKKQFALIKSLLGSILKNKGIAFVEANYNVSGYKATSSTTVGLGIYAKPIESISLFFTEDKVATALSILQNHLLPKQDNPLAISHIISLQRTQINIYLKKNISLGTLVEQLKDVLKNVAKNPASPASSASSSAAATPSFFGATNTTAVKASLEEPPMSWYDLATDSDQDTANSEEENRPATSPSI